MTIGNRPSACRVGPCKLADICGVLTQLSHHRWDFISRWGPHHCPVRFGLNIVDIDAGHNRCMPVRSIGSRMGLDKKIGAPGDFPGSPADKLCGVFIDNGSEFH